MYEIIVKVCNELRMIINLFLYSIGLIRKIKKKRILRNIYYNQLKEINNWRIFFQLIRSVFYIKDKIKL